jgi:exodeoxyribonuclease V gamma subunit
VEVLQDQLLSLFDEDPTLTPQDVIVMTPDIEVYNPHIDAVFGRVEDRDERYLPYTIADRTDPTGLGIFQGIETLLRLPLSRVAVSDLLGLLSIPAFRLRFGIAPDELPTLQKWLEGSGIRWGLNASHRKSLGLPDGIEQNTWRFGLQRMLLGYAVGEGSTWNGIEPFDEIGGLDAALVGPLSAIVAKLEGYRDRLCQPTSPEGWVRRLSALTNDFFLPVESSESLVVNHLADALDQWHKACSEAALSEELPLQVVHEAIFNQLKQAGISQRFLAGRINFCTMMPMRAIPFQVVCLLGMNDGEYPRSAQPLDFDLMAMPGHYRPGDRSRREDDRYLFLEALLSARKQLFISFIGRSIQDNSERKPSVLVSQLIDYIQAGWRMAPPDPSHPAPDGEVTDLLTVDHPLQPFSPTYFQPEKWPHRFTYAHEWQHVFEPPETSLEKSTLPPVKPKTTVPFYPMIQFLKNPIRAFFNQRLQITFRPVETAIDNQEPFAIDGLSPFGAGMQLLSAGLAVDQARRPEAIAAAADRMRNTGELPLFGFGRLSIEALVKPIEKMIGYHEHLLQGWTSETTTVEIRFPVEAETAACEIVEDWLDDIRLRTSPDSKETGSSAFARWDHYPGDIRDKKGKISRYYPLVGPWLKHLFACSQKMDLTTYLIAPDGILKIPPIETSTAIERVNEILFYWSQGLHRLLPVTARTALAYESTRISDSTIEARPKAIKAAKMVYEGNGYNSAGELGYGDGIYLRRVFPSFDDIWEADDGQFQHLADRIYAPLIHAVND